MVQVGNVEFTERQDWGIGRPGNYPRPRESGGSITFTQLSVDGKVVGELFSDDTRKLIENALMCVAKLQELGIQTDDPELLKKRLESVMGPNPAVH